MLPATVLYFPTTGNCSTVVVFIARPAPLIRLRIELQDLYNFCHTYYSDEYQVHTVHSRCIIGVVKGYRAVPRLYLLPYTIMYDP